jgi:tRNA (cmo5U34)-methyltransferase
MEENDPLRDKLFATPRPAQDFHFGGPTAQVFDDMVSRSVPFYAEIQNMVAELCCDFATPGSTVYDLGCSTGTTLLRLDQLLEPDIHLMGLDNSPDMLALARDKAKAARRPVEFVLADFEEPLQLQQASVVMMILTLQFVRPLRREQVVQMICDALPHQGAFILVEKVVSASGLFNRLFIKHYYDYKKRNGYSELEISQKREALENVLIPYRLEENLALLKQAGFRKSEVFFRWYNFCGIVATK